MMIFDDYFDRNDLDDDDFIDKTDLIDNEAVRRAIAAIDVVYEHSCVGGNLHVAVDDGNLDDGCLKFCERSIDENVHEGSPEQLRAERECLAILRDLTEDERWSAYLGKIREY